MPSNMIYIVALGVGFICPRKINLNTQCPPPFPPTNAYVIYEWSQRRDNDHNDNNNPGSVW